MKSIRMASTSLGAVLLAGCAVGPNYQEPRTQTPKQFTSIPATSSRPADISQWWKTFNDPMLNALVRQAVANNPDLRIAASRVRQARAQRGVVQAGLWPEVNLDGGYTHQRSSQYLAGVTSRRVTSETSGTSSGGTGGTTTGGTTGGTSSGGTTSGGTTSGGTTSGGTTSGGTTSGGSTGGSVTGGTSRTITSSSTGGGSFDLWQAGFDASWEIDVFGGTRREIEAADYDTQAAIENMRDTLVTLVSEVGRNYVELRGYQRQLSIAIQNIRSQQETLDLTRTRFKAGLASDLDVARAEAQVETTQAVVPTFQANVNQSIHALSVLIGKEPRALEAELITNAPIPPAPPVIPIGLPSDLLRRRPDVRRAERELAGATARIGVAVADLFPKFSLIGSLGQESEKLKNITNGGANYYSIGPSVSWPIFDAGRIFNNIDLQNFRQQEAAVTYERTVLTSLQDVENALVAYDREQARRQALGRAVDANRRAVDLATQLYTKGLVAFLDVLDTERELYTAEDQLAQSDRQLSSNVVALFKALGGGWELPPGAPEPSTQRSMIEQMPTEVAE